MDNSILHAISPIEGRYRQEVGALRRYFSEYALIRGRLLVEVEYFIALAGHPEVSFLRPLTPALRPRWSGRQNAEENGQGCPHLSTLSSVGADRDSGSRALRRAR